MTEQEQLVAIARRMQGAKLIDQVEYPTPESRELAWFSPEWHGYWTSYKFDEAGNVIWQGQGC